MLGRPRLFGMTDVVSGGMAATDAKVLDLRFSSSAYCGSCAVLSFIGLPVSNLCILGVLQQNNILDSDGEISIAIGTAIYRHIEIIVEPL